MDLAECCGAATPLASLWNVSRSRPTTDQHRCFVAAWLMLILRKRSAPVGPARFPTPLRAPGPAATSTEIPGPLAEGGTGRRDKTPIPRLGGTREGDRGRVRMSSPRRTARGRYHARRIRHSVGRKMALNWNIAERVGIRTLGLIADSDTHPVGAHQIIQRRSTFDSDPFS